MRLNPSVGILSLGCPKNLVDSEVMLGLVLEKGFRLAKDVAHADFAILNTCAFVDDARRESVDRLLELIELKRAGHIKYIILAGCLPQRFAAEIEHEAREVDAFLGTGDFPRIVEAIEKLLARERPVLTGHPNYLYDHLTPRVFLTPSYYRYLKISEGCNHRCSFCTIPDIRGQYRSRSFESVIKEARWLGRNGCRELNLIGQDISYYGKDSCGRFRLAELLKEISSIDGIHWIRLLYTYPSHITDELIDCIARSKKVCHYIDLPLQHISGRILKSMRRGITKSKTIELIGKLRRSIPDLAIRTSLIVGYPGETKSDFEELKEFVRESYFERLGVFLFSKEKGTPAAGLSGQVPLKEMRRRFDGLMVLQQNISRENNKKWLGKTIEILIESKVPKAKQVYIGRSYMDAPEVDGEVHVRSKAVLPIGSFKRVRITDTKEYDLVGEAL
ncbi:MAG: 30S ribosomal protein S12 methylthiotransferase RimO [Candidatus Omnitrophica bacterium]|nr:30S ribosomal protein S12 methylthiotransferase RimO [Candidatus Omnitrophota bacterium]